MNFTLVQLLSYSIGISAIISLVRFSRLDRAYWPFVLFLWLGFLNEIISTISIRYYHTNAINSNIYVLFSSLALVWQFTNWKLFERKSWLPIIIVLFFCCLWTFDNFIYSDIHRFTSYFRIVYSFVTVLMSIHMINKLTAEQNKRLIKNAIFLICVSFIIFFTYKALIEIFWVYGLNSSKVFRVSVYRIMTYINFSVNIIYAIAVLWMPTKREFTLL